MQKPGSIIHVATEVLRQSERLRIRFDPPADGPREGSFVDSSLSSLHRSLSPLVHDFAPSGLYTHQHEAIESVLAGQHTVASTRTSSGKSLIFALPAFNALCRDSDATALFLYPQKALANDQLSKLLDQVESVPSLSRLQSGRSCFISRYDGATPSENRRQIRQQVQLLLTNPDMLHLGILQHHDNSWARFFANLRVVAIDECHEYRGIFGTNVAYVLRRLRQICRLHGSDPTFIATSATISDPQQHMRELVGCDFQLVSPDRDGSLQGRRKFWMVDSGDHYYDCGRRIALELVQAGLNVLAFCPSRVAAERMLSRLRRADGRLPEEVAVYRSGLTGEEREEIEFGLRDGSKRLVFSTSALELGIDIGNLDVVLCVGLPNSMMSLWQRAGRVARGGREGAVILVPGESPLDTYYAQRPQELFSRKYETLAMNLSNERVACQHYACAVHETGRGERGLDFGLLGEQLQSIHDLREQGNLSRPEFYMADPHVEVSLRNTGECNYKIVCGNDTIGELGSFHLLREAPRNALYRHNGRIYRVKDVIRGKRIVRVVPEATRNETVSFVQKSIRQKQPIKVQEYALVTVSLSRIEVTEYLQCVTEKDASGATVRTYPSSGMPTHFLPTEGVCVVLSDALNNELQSRIEIRLESVLSSIERLMANLFPTVSGPCDSQDISSGVDTTRNGEYALFLYDNVYDGVNLTAIAFSKLESLLQRIQERIRSCDCEEEAGCVRCVADPIRSVPSSKAATLAVLDRLVQILTSESPKCHDFMESGITALAEGMNRSCPECNEPIQPAARFCSNCGQPLKEEQHVGV